MAQKKVTYILDGDPRRTMRVPKKAPSKAPKKTKKGGK